MKCVYCGKEYEEGGTTINVSNGTFDVCSNQCKKLTREYLNNDMQYKQRSYLLIFCGSIGFILSTFVFNGTYKLVPMYIGMLIMGLSLIVYPYIFSSFISKKFILNSNNFSNNFNSSSNCMSSKNFLYFYNI